MVKIQQQSDKCLYSFCYCYIKNLKKNKKKLFYNTVKKVLKNLSIDAIAILLRNLVLLQ